MNRVWFYPHFLLFLGSWDYLFFSGSFHFSFCWVLFLGSCHRVQFLCTPKSSLIQLFLVTVNDSLSAKLCVFFCTLRIRKKKTILAPKVFWNLVQKMQNLWNINLIKFHLGCVRLALLEAEERSAERAIGPLLF